MNTALKTFITISALSLAGLTHGAGYLKIEGIKGESKAAQQEAQPKGTPARKGMQDLKANNDKKAGLLLPAVQSVREPAGKSSSKAGKSKGKVEATWKVEEGSK